MNRVAGTIVVGEGKVDRVADEDLDARPALHGQVPIEVVAAEGREGEASVLRWPAERRPALEARADIANRGRESTSIDGGTTFTVALYPS